MEIDLSTKCRVCLNEDDEMHHIFAEFDQGVTLLEILTTTTNFEVDENEGLSPFMCRHCTGVVVDFYNFKTIYKENETQIRALLTSAVEETKQCASPLPVIEEQETILVQEVKEDDGDDQSTIKLEIYSDSDDDSSTTVTTEVKCAKYSCKHCRDLFLSEDDVKSHLILAHNVKQLDYDVVSHTEQNIIILPCKFCTLVFDNRKAYQEHLANHRKYVCDVCGAGFLKRSYLKDHNEVHLTEKRHVCNFCNKAFKRRTVLVKHRRIHTHPRQCVCEICGKAFNDKGTLKTHIMLLHIKARNFACMICGIRFPLKATLEKHIRRHQNKQKEFYCQHCPLAYRDKSSLDRHIQVKHSGAAPQAVCDQCHKRYSTVSNLLKHKRTCHGNGTTSQDEGTQLDSN